MGLISENLKKLKPTYLGGGTKSQEPPKNSALHRSNQVLGSYLPSTYITTGQPLWRNLSEMVYLLKCYYENPVVQAAVNIKAEAFANMEFLVRDLKSGEEIPLNEYEADRGALYNLIQRPNPLQGTYEWLRQMKVNYEVFQNAYLYASVPVGWENSFDYRDVKVINNLAPYSISPILTGKWLDATNKDEIISNYRLELFNGGKRDLPTNTVLHINGINITMDETFTQGKSKLLALQRPISNIDAAYESRNVMILRRGALGMLTSDKKDDAMGVIPLRGDEIEEVQEAFKKYGLLEDQYSYMISPQPLRYERMAMSVKELMLFEEVESDAIAVANALGIPELLLKYYIQGGTFENLNLSEKRLYDSTIIPESRDFMNSLNSFLGTHEYDIELLGSYDHLNILQPNQKEEAEKDKTRQDTALDAFMVGAFTYNQYLTYWGMPEVADIGELRIWDLEPEQLAAINRNKPSNNNSDETR